MKANELRIGNLVNHNVFGNCKITALDYEMICIQRNDLDIKEWFDLEDSNRIPLTEEWLLKLGLVKQDGYPYKFLNGYLKIRNGIYFFKYYDLEVELQFIHQLQNLYFALTNKELNYETK